MARSSVPGPVSILAIGTVLSLPTELVMAGFGADVFDRFVALLLALLVATGVGQGRIRHAVTRNQRSAEALNQVRILQTTLGCGDPTCQECVH